MQVPPDLLSGRRKRPAEPDGPTLRSPAFGPAPTARPDSRAPPEPRATLPLAGQHLSAECAAAMAAAMADEPRQTAAPPRFGPPPPPPPQTGKKKRQTAWLSDEDATLRAGVAELGASWKAIADRLPGRSDDMVRGRWRTLSKHGGGEAAGRPLLAVATCPLAQAALPSPSPQPDEACGGGLRCGWSLAEQKNIPSLVVKRARAADSSQAESSAPPKVYPFSAAEIGQDAGRLPRRPRYCQRLGLPDWRPPPADPEQSAEG